MNKTEQILLRLEPELLKRVEEVHDQLLALGENITRAQVIRMFIREGLRNPIEIMQIWSQK